MATAIGAGPRKGGRALFAELRPGAILVLAPGTLHPCSLTWERRRTERKASRGSKRSRRRCGSTEQPARWPCRSGRGSRRGTTGCSVKSTSSQPAWLEAAPNQRPRSTAPGSTPGFATKSRALRSEPRHEPDRVVAIDRLQVARAEAVIRQSLHVVDRGAIREVRSKHDLRDRDQFRQ